MPTMKSNMFLKSLEIIFHLSLHVGLFFTCSEQPTFMIVARIFLHLVIDVWNLCQLSIFSIISLCFAFLACTKARMFACSQFTYQGFLAQTSIVESEFWLTTCFLGFFFVVQLIDLQWAAIAGELLKIYSNNLYESMSVKIDLCCLCMFRINLVSRMLILIFWLACFVWLRVLKQTWI